MLMFKNLFILFLVITISLSLINIEKFDEEQPVNASENTGITTSAIVNCALCLLVSGITFYFLVLKKNI